MALANTRSRRKPSMYDANTPAPEYLTHELIQRIRSLPDCPGTLYLKDQFLSKFVSKDTDPASSRRNAAIRKWLAVERENEATNDRLQTTLSDYNILPRVSWSRFVEKLQTIVRDIIGETVPEEALIGSFSGGASTSRARTVSHPANKYLGQADITPAARAWFELTFESCPGWNVFGDLLSINEVKGNILFTVPKNTTIDRVACKEPDLNMFLQKGVGDYLRRCLRREGINLNDQTRNQDLARRGSITGDLATLDLSSASDSVSSALVELALPPLWYSLLNGLRSPITLIDGEEHVNEMFSSMGNGFTFELESLLFYALSRTTAYFRGVSGIISVYGDDIICPSALAADIITVLEYCGFSINLDKSFVSGSFRESCGGHYNNGVDITPFYIRKPIETLTDIIHIANAIRRWSARLGIGILDPRVEDIWMWLKGHVPRSLWGGQDTSSITQLVSPDEPIRRLVPMVHRNKDVTDLWLNGTYVHWLNTTMGRDTPTDAVVTSDLSKIGTRYRSRPALAHRSCSIPLFLGEVWCPVTTNPI